MQGLSAGVYAAEPVQPCGRFSAHQRDSGSPAQYKALMAEFTELHKSLARLRGQVHVNTVVDLFAENQYHLCGGRICQQHSLCRLLKRQRRRADLGTAVPDAAAAFDDIESAAQFRRRTFVPFLRIRFM